MPVILGVDLSGPGNIAHTAAVACRAARGSLEVARHELGVEDARLLALAEGASLVGLDAPLSYQPGGGDRPGDRALRRRVVAAGLPSGTVMTPTMTRMAYLTLRGVSVSRLLAAQAPAARVVEVHPAAALALRGAPAADLRALKRDGAARARLLAWLERRGLRGARALPADSDHLVAACACAFAAWKWARGEAAWCEPAAPPAHPYDYVA